MSLQVCNIYVGNLLHGSLAHAIEHGCDMGSYDTFSVQCSRNKEEMWYVRVT